MRAVEAEAGRPAWPDRVVAAAIVAASLGLSAAFIARTAFTVGGRTYFSLFDDAMVSMRYARNLAHGYGLVWNPHQPAVEGYSNFLWTLWMAFLHVVRIPEATVSLAVVISGALLLVANVLIVGAIARLLTPSRLAPLLAMGLTALYYPLVYWTLRGLEVGLLATLVSAAVLLSLRLARAPSRRDLVLLCAAVAAAVLTRVDALLLMVPAAVYATAARRRLGPPLLAAIVVPLAGQTAFREAYYHALLPNTYYLKVQGVPLAERLGRGAWTLLEVEAAHLWLPTVVAAVYLGFCRRPRSAWLLAATFAIACLYSVYVGGDAWEWMLYSNRYVAPAVPLLLVLAACGLTSLDTDVVELRAALAVLGGGAAVLALGTRHVLPWRPEDGLGRVPLQVRPALLMLPWVALMLASRRFRPGGAARAVAVPSVLAALLFAAVNGAPIRNWIAHNGHHVHDDEQMSRYGLALRRETLPTAQIAVVWAGAIPYFSHRAAVDLLGKNDRTVAHLPARRPFWPGHSKWDYAYSIGRLRPDVVAQLWKPTPADRASLSRWGYRHVAFDLYVRRADPAAPIAALAPAAPFANESSIRP